jgi:hypothetical protein
VVVITPDSRSIKKVAKVKNIKHITFNMTTFLKKTRGTSSLELSKPMREITPKPNIINAETVYVMLVGKPK